MTVKQWKALHARLSCIHAVLEDAEIKAYVGLAMQTVDKRVADIEKGSSQHGQRMDKATR